MISAMEFLKFTSFLVLKLLILSLLMSSLTAISSYPFSEISESSITEDAYATYHYTRFTEVEKACRPMLSSSSSLDFDANRAYSIKRELSFVNGDWRQDSGESPLMPFDSSDAPETSSGLPDPLRLASFTLLHIDPVSRVHGAMNVSGALSVGISRNGTTPDGSPLVFPDFHIWPGSSDLGILFEGVYTESKENGGERVLCLLGHSKLPSRQLDSSGPWGWAKHSSSSNFQPSLVEDDKVLLILRYPKNFTLTSRAVRGELRSLNEKSSHKYFDDVRLTSQLGVYSKYQFVAEKLTSKAFNHYYPNQADILGENLEVYKGNRFCELLDRFVSVQQLLIVPNWKCNSTDEFCSKLGPFESSREIKASDGGFANVGLIMKDLRCERTTNSKISFSCSVSTVFRVISPLENYYSAFQRSGLDGFTISAEGVWNSSTGLLCMVGCLGLGEDGCQSRICLYVLNSFSIKQRNIVVGQISSISETNKNLYYPLTFECPVHPLELSNGLSSFPPPKYVYSKDQVGRCLLREDQAF